jgi:hypothetical protein
VTSPPRPRPPPRTPHMAQHSMAQPGPGPPRLGALSIVLVRPFMALLDGSARQLMIDCCPWVNEHDSGSESPPRAKMKHRSFRI